MSNGTRHLLGAIAGIVAIPVVSALVFGGMGLSLEVYARLASGAPLYVGTGVIAAGAVLVALLVGTRISPLASLIPGLVFTGIAVVAAAAPRTFLGLLRDLPSPVVHVGARLPLSPAAVAEDAASTGTFLLVGLVLLVASVAPSRWRGATRTARVATAAGLHRAGPAEEPRFPGSPEPDEPRGVTPFPPDTEPVPEQAYGDSGPQSPFGGSGPQSPFGDARPEASYGDSGPQSPYGGSGPQSSFGDARSRSAAYDSGPQSPYDSGPESRYGGSPAQPLYGAPTPQPPYEDSASQPPYGAPTPRSPYESGPQSPYGGLGGGEPQAPYRSAFEPPTPPGAGDDFSGYAPGNRPSSWSGPQEPFPRDPYPPQPGRPARPAGDDPYAAPIPPTTPASYSPPPEQPWGPAPDADRVPPRDPFPDTPQADPGRRSPNADDTTNRLPWTEEDRARFRDPRDPRNR